MPPPEEVPLATVPEAGPAVEAVVAELPAVRESRKRGPEGVDANAPLKSLRRDHTDRPSGSSCGGKSLAAMQLCLDSNVFMSEGVLADVSDPDPLAFADAPSHPPVDVAQYTEAEMKRAAEGKNAELMRELEDIRAQFLGLKEFKWYEDDRVEQLDARLDALSIDFDEELYPHMLTAIAGRRWVIGHGLRLATMKCAESLEMRQAFADVVSAGVAKGMSEGLKHGVEHGRSQLDLESIEAYDPKAEAKFIASLQSLKDLKFSLIDQLEGLKDASMDVIMAALYLKSDTGGGGDAPQYIRDLHPSSSQLTIPVYPEYNVNLARQVAMGSQLRLRWVIRHVLRLAMMKCAESLEMRQAFADVVSAGVAKDISEGLKHGVEHGRS
nr:hypothetical protein [Tanacetum cinerariifolium]